MNVVVVGSLNRDYVCRVTDLPARGQTTIGQDVVVGSGGKGGNQAVAAARAGASVTFIGRVGADADGDALRADLVDAGVDTDRLRVSPEVPTGRAFVFVAADGENAIVVSPGANAAMTVAEVAADLTAVAGPGAVVVTQAEVPTDVVSATIVTAAGLGARPVLNLAPYLGLADDVLAVCDPLVLNQAEAAALLGRGLADATAAAAGAEALAGRCASVVITLGADGAVYATGRQATHVVANQVAAVDTTGAGDAFTGFVAASLAAGASLDAAVRRGVAAGTYTVSRLGARPSFAEFNG